jgi:alkylation response protein AidB-like acyl-CoA dehydrogenase
VLAGFVADVLGSSARRVRSGFMASRDSIDLSEDQHALQNTLRDLLGGQLPSSELRSALDSDPGYSQDLHARLLGELGLGALIVPEEFGGRGPSPAETCVVHTELGRALYPGPYLPSCLAAAALLAAGDPQACKRWLPLLANGTVTGTVAAADEVGQWSRGSEDVRAEYATGGWRLYGRRWFVIAGRTAGIMVVPAIIDSGLAMFLAESGSDGLTTARQLDLDLTRRIGITTFVATPALLLTRDGETVLARAEHELLIATAAEAAGGIGWCLDASLAYVEDRERLGRPAGSFEAAAQLCVDMVADLESVSSAARYAAVATASDAADAPKAARVAALRAGEAYRGVSEAAIGLFGGVGFAREHDAHLYYRRAWSAERLAGGPQAHRTALEAL